MRVFCAALFASLLAVPGSLATGNADADTSNLFCIDTDKSNGGVVVCLDEFDNEQAIPLVRNPGNLTASVAVHSFTRGSPLGGELTFLCPVITAKLEPNDPPVSPCSAVATMGARDGRFPTLGVAVPRPGLNLGIVAFLVEAKLDILVDGQGQENADVIVICPANGNQQPDCSSPVFMA